MQGSQHNLQIAKARTQSPVRWWAGYYFFID